MRKIIIAIIILIILGTIGGFCLYRHNEAKKAELATHPTPGLLLDETTEATTEQTEAPTKLDLGNQSSSDTENNEIIFKNADGETEASVTDPSQEPLNIEQKESIDSDTPLIDQARENDKKIETPQETQYQDELKEVSPDEMDKLHEDFQAEIDRKNMEEAQKLLDKYYNGK